MQPAAKPEDINTILGRFHTWAEKEQAAGNGSGNGKGNGNGNGHTNGVGSEELREIPYEEAIRQYRNRSAARGQRRAAPPKAQASPRVPSPSHRNAQAESEAVPLTYAAPQFIPKLPEVEPAAEPAPVKKTAAAAAEKTASTAPKTATAAVPEMAQAMPARAMAEDWLRAVAALRAESASEAVTKEPRTGSASPAMAAPVDSQQHGPATRSWAELSQAVTTEIRAETQSEPAPPAPLRTKTPRRETPPPPTRVATTSQAPAPPQKTKSAIKATPRAKTVRLTARPPIPVQSQPKVRARTAAASRYAATPPEKPPATTHPPFRQVLANSVQQPSVPAPLVTRFAPVKAPVPVKPAASAKKAAPDRDRRITTRFSAAEERRIEKQAAELGVTVSAYLRQCALAAMAAAKTVPATQPVAATAKTSTPRTAIVGTTRSIRPIRVGNSRTARAVATENSATSRGTIARSRRASLATAAKKRRTSPAVVQPTYPPHQYYAPTNSLLGGWLALLRNRFLGPPVRFSNEA